MQGEQVTARPASETNPPGRSAPAALTALACSLTGGALLVASAFVAEHEVPDRFHAVANTFWQSGPGWSFVAGGILISALAWRAYSQRRCSWLGFWIGPLVIFAALRAGVDGGLCNRLLTCVKAPSGAGPYVAVVGGVLVMAGWAIALVAAWFNRPAPPRADVRIPARFEQCGEKGTGPVGLRRRQMPGPGLWALVLYAGLSLALFGGPVLAHLGSRIVAANGIDPSSHMWFFSWWPHAILHSSNPFTTNALFAPEGYNLAWVTSVPGPSLLVSPVTLIFGPVASWNVLTLAAPAASAWTAFLLCRHVTHTTAPSLAGGYLFGFSPYMLQMLQGSPNLYLIALLPLLVLLVIRRVEGSLSDRWFVTLTALALALQALTGIEILLTASVFGAFALLGGYALLHDYREALVRTVKLLIAAYAIAGLLIAPMLFNLAFRPHAAPTQSQPIFAVDLLSWFLPNNLLAIARNHRLGGVPSYYGGPAYLGVPLAILVLAYGWRYRRERLARLLMIVLLVPTIASLGGRLVIAGKFTAVGLPWAVFDDLPGVDRAVPQRFPLFTFMAAAIVLAMWLARDGSRSRWALALLALAFIVPDVGNAAWRYTLPSEPTFFKAGRYQRYLRASDRVIVYPLFDGQRWQAQGGFGFLLAGGYVGAFPASYERYPIFRTFITGVLPAEYANQLRRFVVDKGVTAIVVAKRSSGPLTQKLFGSLGVEPVDTAGVLLYRLHPMRSVYDKHRASN